jgi:hypothetical protein
VSPELVLVDRTLASVAREELPAQGDVFDALERLRAQEPLRRMRSALVSNDSEVRAADAGDARGLRARLADGLLLSAAAAAAVLGVIVVTHDDDEDGTTGRREVMQTVAAAVGTSHVHQHPMPHAHSKHGASSPAPARATAPARKDHSPHREGHRTHTPAPSAVPGRALSTLSWKARPAASYYRVRVVRASGKHALVFEIWTDQTSVRIPSTRITGGKRRPLEHGVYRWTVQPVFSSHGMPPKRQPIASGVFVR